jgi:dihydroorotate dehydrogenase
MSAAWCPTRLGLAGGIDKDGSRAAELLAAGFASVEFGTVTPRPEPGSNPGVAALAARLSALAPRRFGDTRIGIGIGSGSLATPTALPAEWLSGLVEAWGAADYLSFNLSARCYRPLLATGYLPLLSSAIAAIVAERRRRTAASGRYVALALKLPLGSAGALPLVLAEVAADAGFDAVTAVLPEGAARLDRLQTLSSLLRDKAALLAVGGIRNAADIRAVLAAGADGVQVHTVFAQLGAACLPALLEH